MSKSNFKEFWLNKFIFPKIYQIDKPGIIISEVPRLFGSYKIKKRDVYYFEKILSNLQIDTIKEIGIKNFEEMYYKIGKDLGIGYLLLSNIKKIPNFLISDIFKSICKVTWASGVSISKDIQTDKNGIYILSGSDTMFCRESKNAAFFEGLYSGILSYLTGKNIEAKY